MYSDLCTGHGLAIESSEHAPGALFSMLMDNMNTDFQSLSALSVNVTHSGRCAEEIVACGIEGADYAYDS